MAKRYGDEAVVGFFPADHWIAEPEKFTATVQAAQAVALETGSIVTLGITPSFPSTGYGYIEAGEPCEGEPRARDVVRFVEKPKEKEVQDSLVLEKEWYPKLGIEGDGELFLASMGRPLRNADLCPRNSRTVRKRRFSRLSDAPEKEYRLRFDGAHPKGNRCARHLCLG